MRTQLDRRQIRACRLQIGFTLAAFVISIAAWCEPQVKAVRAVGVTASDLDASVAFYTGVLTFERVNEVESAGEAYEHLQGVFGLRARSATLKLGDEMLILTQYLAPEGQGIPGDSRSNDRWFQHVAIVTSDMDKAYAYLREHHIRHASSGPQRLPDWNKNSGGIEAFYFKDPDGHVLETIHFPAGKGNPNWQQPTERLFLGIDHTAIVVADTDATLRFYRDALGMQVAGESENYGVEQEHLNNVFGARLRITALRAASGLGVELLEYLAPRNGRPFPATVQSNDLVHWETILASADVSGAGVAAKSAGGMFVSPGAVELPDGSLGYREGLLVSDPDGHAVKFVGE